MAGQPKVAVGGKARGWGARTDAAAVEAGAGRARASNRAIAAS